MKSIAVAVGLFHRRGCGPAEEPGEEPAGDAQAPTAGKGTATSEDMTLYTKYDFVPGDKLIFEIIGGLLFFGSVAIYFLLEWRDRRRARKRSCAVAQPSGSTA